MPVYPGTDQPIMAPASTFEKDGFRETLLTMFSHTGTHMDAPAHLFPEGKRLDSYPASHFVGLAVTVDCTSLRPGQAIGMACLSPYGKLVDEAEFLLFRTGWGGLWHEKSYFSRYPCPDAEVMDYLAASRKKGVGMDSISLDPTEAVDLPNHRKLLTLDHTVIIENLANLEKTVGMGLFTFCALPLKYENSDGAPVRAIAFLGAGA